jgi:hypothetical protein
MGGLITFQRLCNMQTVDHNNGISILSCIQISAHFHLQNISFAHSHLLNINYRRLSPPPPPPATLKIRVERYLYYYFRRKISRFVIASVQEIFKFLKKF